MADILFVQSLANFYFGLMSISAVLKDHGYTTDLLISGAESEIVEYANSGSYAMIGFAVMPCEEKLIFKKISALKISNPKVKIVIGGLYPTLYPDKAMSITDVDYICRGEGEYPVLELIDALKNGKEIRNIHNLWIREGNEVRKNPMRPLNDLDTLPNLDIELYKKYKRLFEDPSKLYKFSRGCPFSCSFCYNNLLKNIYAGLGKYVRYKSPQRVVDELRSIKEKTNLKRVMLYDDNFLFSKTYLREFSEIFPKLNIDIAGYGRADQVDEETAELLKRCRVRCLILAVETGNEHYRNYVLKKGFTDRQIIDSVWLLKSKGIRTFSANMLGLPGETVESAISTLDLNISAGFDFASVGFYNPYPGVPLSEAAGKMYNLNDSFFDNLPIDMSVEPVLPVASKSVITNIQKLMPVTVMFPVLRPLLRFLIKLPPNPVYELLYNLTRMYAFHKLSGITVKSIFRYGFQLYKQEALRRKQ